MLCFAGYFGNINLVCQPLLQETKKRWNGHGRLVCASVQSYVVVHNEYVRGLSCVSCWQWIRDNYGTLGVQNGLTYGNTVTR